MESYLFANPRWGFVRRALVNLTLFAVPLTGFAQVVEFSNCRSNGEVPTREPIYAADCTTPLRGGDYRVELFLYSEAAPGGFGAPVGPAKEIDANGCFSFGPITVPGAIPGTRPTFVLRAWDVRSAGGGAFDTAQIRGISATFQLNILSSDPGAPVPPLPPTGGFASFCLQDRCRAELVPASASFRPCGGPGEFTLNLASTDCEWSVALGSDVRWISLNGPVHGSGTAQLKFTVAPNRKSTPRSATITTPAGAFEITQAGVTPPVFDLTATGFQSDGFFHMKVVGDPCTRGCVEASEDLVHWECLNEFELPAWGFHSPFLTDPQNYAKAYFRVVLREGEE